MELDRSPSFNNAGVRMVATGNMRVALDMFRGALEIKLAYEHWQQTSTLLAALPSMASAAPPELHLVDESTNPQVPAMITIMHDENSYVSDSDEHEPTDSAPGAGDTTRLGAFLDDVPTVPVGSRGYDPFLYDSAFPIHETDSSSAQLSSAIIVFNLGLVHQMECRHSPKAAAFYEISAALMANQPESDSSCLLVRVALLNNFGVWCYENGDGESLRTCMEHLSAVLEQDPDAVPVNVRDGLRTNVRWMLTPPHGASPAA